MIPKVPSGFIIFRLLVLIQGPQFCKQEHSSAGLSGWVGMQAGEEHEEGKK